MTAKLHNGCKVQGIELEISRKPPPGWLAFKALRSVVKADGGEKESKVLPHGSV